MTALLARTPHLLLACLALLPVALAAQEENATLPAVQRGTVEVIAGTRGVALPLLETAVGPLFPLIPILELIEGASLEIGPLGQAHTLILYDEQAVFGPGSPAMTLGRRIIPLSQAPQTGERGILVPLDLLHHTIGELLGYDLRWLAAEARLLILTRSPRQLPVEVDLVHVPGVSTLVLTFPERPRYRVETEADRISVQIVGDELLPPRRPPPTSSPFLRNLIVGRRSVQLELEPGTLANRYELQRPFRLVFDLQQKAVTTLGAPASPPTPRESLDVIVIDPGHGGSETGATGPSGVHEKELTLVLARTLARRLEARLPVRAVLTRDEDADLPHDLRSAIANQNKADLFISLHCNSSLGSTARGAETYFLSLEASDRRAAAVAESENASSTRAPSGDPLNDLQLILWDLAQSRHLAESQRFAALVQEELNQTLGMRDRGVKQAPFRVLMGAAMPAVLVELGFLSNPAEEARLLDPAGRADLVEALVRAVIRYRAERESRR